MNTYVNRVKAFGAYSFANERVQEKANTNSSHRFVDNRQESMAYQTLQEAANNSAQSQQTAQFQQLSDNYPIQQKENRTGLPDELKAGIENLSGYSMDDVRVHYNSDKPASLQAHAYAQGTDIHLAPGQEKHLPHEAWHVVQQKQGRVQPTMQMKGGVDVNDDEGLEKEADVMGASAMQLAAIETGNLQKKNSWISDSGIVQRLLVCYTKGDLGYEDAYADNFQFATIGDVIFQRPAIANYTKADGDNTGSIKHFVPHQWISKGLIDNHIVGFKRHEVHTRLTAILEILGIGVPTVDWTANVASFNLWVGDAFDSICDWEENLFRHSDSVGDGNGTKFDTPNDAIVLNRVQKAAQKLNMFGLASKPVLI